MPTIGNSTNGGFDFSLPYYWNIAPNYDATFTPHVYGRRGVMMGGDFRYLTPKSSGEVEARYLPHDRSFANFLAENEAFYPRLQNLSTDRWAVQARDFTSFEPNFSLRVNYQQVSDDYFLQDFSSNLALLTERQLPQEGELRLSTDNWVFSGLLQRYQTIQPINTTPIDYIYQRLPQLYALGSFDNLFLDSQVRIHGQFDNFYWTKDQWYKPEGPRYYLSPSLVVPFEQPWGFLRPNVDLVQNYYEIRHWYGLPQLEQEFTIPRYGVDAGLFFDRDTHFFSQSLIQTLEPHIYYLNVPYRNQTLVPVYDSAYYIFSFDQLFRKNRFSGLDRIGDTNQLSYAMTTRWLSEKTGTEKASLSVGQIRYFRDRGVKLCQSIFAVCVDNPLVLGYLSPTAESSPVASRGVYHFDPRWSATGDYIWDPHTESTNNANVMLRYQSGVNRFFGMGYTYMVQGDITALPYTIPDLGPLHQASLFYAWPHSEHWSSLGTYSYNIAKGYDMVSFLGIQYDTCCWAVRLLGGRSFSNLGPSGGPAYNTNVYLQIQLKGLGSVGNGSPANLIQVNVPGYMDPFYR